MRVFTIGFTKKSARTFFTKLRESGAQRVVDVRLNNVSQLAGFAKKDDLQFFLRELCQMGYVHLPILAPTQEMLDAYKKDRGEWSAYEQGFLALMKFRQIESSVQRAQIAEACLLCSEERPDHCHRRLVTEYLRETWGDVEIVHLV
jgi:uncharacterized protein (DUF488 family)